MPRACMSSRAPSRPKSSTVWIASGSMPRDGERSAHGAHERGVRVLGGRAAAQHDGVAGSGGRARRCRPSRWGAPRRSTPTTPKGTRDLASSCDAVRAACARRATRRPGRGARRSRARRRRGRRRAASSRRSRSCSADGESVGAAALEVLARSPRRSSAGGLLRSRRRSRAAPSRLSASVSRPIAARRVLGQQHALACGRRRSWSSAQCIERRARSDSRIGRDRRRDGLGVRVEPRADVGAAQRRDRRGRRS